MSEVEATLERVDVLLFRVGKRVYAADATQVLRIDRRGGAAAREALGPLDRGDRALVVQGPQGEELVPVDAVRGIRAAPVSELRRAPAAVAGHPCTIGFWLDGDTPVVLIDLARTL
jgi:chemotaxis signal transduction protein